MSTTERSLACVPIRDLTHALCTVALENDDDAEAVALALCQFQQEIRVDIKLAGG